MNLGSSLLVFAASAALVAACSGSGAGGGTAGHPGTGGQSSSGTGGASVGTGGHGGGANCATCTAGQRCDVFNTCQYPPVPYACVACQQRPYCGSDGKVYDSECAAIAVGAKPGFSCAAPPGRYACGAYYCDASNEDCGSFSPIGLAAFAEAACVPCATVTGRACGDDGVAYSSACALLQAGHRRGSSCPGFVPCGTTVCDSTATTCVMGAIADCEGGSPSWSCAPLVDAGP